MEAQVKLTDEQIVRKLQLPPGVLDVVIDTDAFNEVDDQFALVYALASPERIRVQAVYAAPFYNDKSVSPADGMEKSYQEILKIFAMLGRDRPGWCSRGRRPICP